MQNAMLKNVLEESSNTKIQKSFQNNKNTLYLIATPIGNLEDITLRALKILKEVDLIYCEDTRVTKVLLDYYNISKPLFSYHDHNKEIKKNEIITKLKNNNIALVSDAGTPLINDPGYELVNEVINNNYNIVSIPGASAFLNSLIISNLNPMSFLYYGFLNKKKNKRLEELHSLKDLKYTIIFYETKIRLEESLKELKEIFNNRRITIVRELTKLHEEIIWTNLDDPLIPELKGEFCLVVEGNLDNKNNNINNNIDYHKEIDYLLNLGVKKTLAIKEISKKYNLNRQEIYKEYEGK